MLKRPLRERFSQRPFQHKSLEIIELIYHNTSSAHRRRRPQRDCAAGWSFPAIPLSILLKNVPDDFCASAWLCTRVNSGRFRADAGTKDGFPAKNSPHNGERVRSLLCGREALAKP